MLADAELRKDYDQELLNVDKKVEDDPEHDKSQLARQNYVAAKSLIQRKQFRQAIKFLENAIELEENVPEYHVAFGSVIGLNPVRRDEAEEHLRHGLELDPHGPRRPHGVGRPAGQAGQAHERDPGAQRGTEMVPPTTPN